MHWSNSSEFVEIVIRPYLQPFFSLVENTGPAVSAGFFYMLLMVTTFTSALFTTPEIWWKGLAILIFLDFIAGHIRVFTDSEVRFSIKKWGRTAYKIASYTIAGLSISAGANMFPEALGWTQYVAFSVLAGMEIYSILKNLKMLAILSVIGDFLMDKYNLDSMEDFRDRVEDKREENRQEQEDEDNKRR